MPDITAADIRANRPAPVPFEVPGWGGTVYIRKVPLSLRLSLYERMDGDSASFTGDDILGLVIACVVDAQGEPLFTADDAAWLDAEFADEVPAVFAKVSEVAGWGTDAVEDAAGN